jgi:septal ring factor EnvC (AmiA/AmiB activator)
MKTKSVIIAFIIIIGVLITILITTPSGYKRQIEEVKKELRQVELERDSLYGQLKITQDGLKVANYNLKQAQISSEKAKKETKYYKDKYEKIRFVDFANDSIRSSELSKLYPSYKNR